MIWSDDARLTDGRIVADSMNTDDDIHVMTIEEAAEVEQAIASMGYVPAVQVA